MERPISVRIARGVLLVAFVAKIPTALLASSIPPPRVMTTAEDSARQRWIRVRIDREIAHAEVRGFDLSLEGGAARIRQMRLSEWHISCEGRRIQARRDRSVRLLTFDSPLKIATPGGFLTYRGRPTRGEIEIHSRGRRCDVVNRLDLEKYLDGLVRSEFSPLWNAEAIAAQVVAARTYAVYQMRAARKAGRFYDVESTTMDQAYGGAEGEHYRAARLIDRTRGLVLTSTADTQHPIKAFYHSTCGGQTELPHVVWGRPYAGFAKRVKCPYCHRSPAYRWKVETKASEIEKAFREGSEEKRSQRALAWPKGWRSMIQEGRLAELKTVRSEPSGRIETVQAFWEKATGPHRVRLRLDVPATLFRSWIGVARLKSTRFEIVSRRRGLWSFSGLGNGHGVGMCQWGAKIMGDQGHSMIAILRHYYPGARLRKLW